MPFFHIAIMLQPQTKDNLLSFYDWEVVEKLFVFYLFIYLLIFEKFGLHLYSAPFILRPVRKSSATNCPKKLANR